MAVENIPLTIALPIVIIVVLLFSIVFGALYIFHFTHTKDQCSQFGAKIVILLCFVLAAFSALVFPLDVGVKSIVNDSTIQFIFGIFWQIFYIFVIFTIFVILPFMICFYENYNPNTDTHVHSVRDYKEEEKKPLKNLFMKLYLGGKDQATNCIKIDKNIICQCIYGTIYGLIVLIIVLIIICATYAGVFFFLPADLYYQQIVHKTLSTDFVDTNGTTTYETFGNAMNVLKSTYTGKLTESSKKLELIISIVVWAITIFNVIGWILLSILAGFGMSSLPIDQFLAFLKRPRRIGSQTFVKDKKALMEKSEKLMEVGKKMNDLRMKGKIGRKDFLLFKDFKEATIQLEKDWRLLDTSFNAAGGNIFKPIFQCCFGFICLIVGFIFLVNAITYLAVPDEINTLIKNSLGFEIRYGFISLAMDYGDKFVGGGFPVFGGFVFGFFSYYLFLTILSGNSLLSSQIPLLNFHPMKEKETLTNGMLFNTGLVLMCSLTLNQFMAKIFSSYAPNSALSGMFFGIIEQIRYLQYFFKYIHYLFFICVVIGFFVSIIFAILPKKTKNEKELEKMLKRIEKNPGNFITRPLIAIKNYFIGCVPFRVLLRLPY